MILVLEGELVTELRDGRQFRLTAGMSYLVADSEVEGHRSSTTGGVTLFIVD